MMCHALIPLFPDTIWCRLKYYSVLYFSVSFVVQHPIRLSGLLDPAVNLAWRYKKAEKQDSSIYPSTIKNFTKHIYGFTKQCDNPQQHRPF